MGVVCVASMCSLQPIAAVDEPKHVSADRFVLSKVRNVSSGRVTGVYLGIWVFGL